MKMSKHQNPRDKQAALKLFEDRQKVYCLADWHFIVKPGYTSYEVARSIIDDLAG